MGFQLSQGMIKAAVIEHGATFKILTYMASLADDQDDEKEGRERGRNIFPSVSTIADNNDISVRNAQRKISELKEAGWIRERPTERYKKIYGVNNEKAPRCYELNLSLMARRIDAKNIAKDNKIKRGTDTYQALYDSTGYQQDDWKKRVFSGSYKARELDWDGDIDSLTPDLWKDQESDGQHEHQSVTNEEIKTIANRHRIQ